MDDIQHALAVRLALGRLGGAGGGVETLEQAVEGNTRIDDGRGWRGRIPPGDVGSHDAGTVRSRPVAPDHQLQRTELRFGADRIGDQLVHRPAQRGPTGLLPLLAGEQRGQAGGVGSAHRGRHTHGVGQASHDHHVLANRSDGQQGWRQRVFLPHAFGRPVGEVNPVGDVIDQQAFRCREPLGTHEIAPGADQGLQKGQAERHGRSAEKTPAGRASILGYRNRVVCHDYFPPGAAASPRRMVNGSLETMLDSRSPKLPPLACMAWATTGIQRRPSGSSSMVRPSR